MLLVHPFCMTRPPPRRCAHRPTTSQVPHTLQASLFFTQSLNLYQSVTASVVVRSARTSPPTTAPIKTTSNPLLRNVGWRRPIRYSYVYCRNLKLLANPLAYVSPILIVHGQLSTLSSSHSDVLAHNGWMDFVMLGVYLTDDCDEMNEESRPHDEIHKCRIASIASSR